MKLERGERREERRSSPLFLLSSLLSLLSPVS